MYGIKITPKLWQDKRTGQVILTENPSNHVESSVWHLNFREVRLYHDPVRGQVFVLDVAVKTTLAALGHPDAVEVDRETFNYWKMLYENPDL